MIVLSKSGRKLLRGKSELTESRMIERLTKDGKKLAWVGSDEPRTDVR